MSERGRSAHSLALEAAARPAITEADIDANPWASCGPCALAAVLGRPLASIRDAFPAQREGRTWTNAAHMLAAVRAVSDFGAAWNAPTVGHHAPWPRRGVVLIQFNGSWDAMPIGHPAQLQRSHWIATIGKGEPVGAQWAREDLVWDVNQVGCSALAAVGWWTTRAEWERVEVPLLAEDFGKKATGKWWPRASIEVETGGRAAVALWKAERRRGAVTEKRT